MQAVLSRFGSHRWSGLVIAVGVLAPLCFVSLPGAPSWVPASFAGVAREAQDGMAEGAGIVPAAERSEARGASLHAMERMLGQLEAADEAALREALLGARLSGEAFASHANAKSEQDLARFVDLFSTRLSAMTIPEGTRTALAATLASYEHGVLAQKETVAAERVDRTLALK